MIAPMRLADKVIVICGLGRGMSRAMAYLFAQEGAAVMLAARKAELADETAAEIVERGGRALSLVVDMQASDQVAGMYAQAVETFGRIDATCLLPGGFFTHMNDIDTIEPEFFQMVQRNHIDTVFWGVRHAVPHLKAAGGGSIVTISAGYKTRRDANVAYAAAKEAVIGLTKNMARELHPHSIRVNCIAPGLVRNLLGERPILTPNTSTTRSGQPEDIAYAALYLVSNESPWMTGQVLVLDGGDEIYAGQDRP